MDHLTNEQLVRLVAGELPDESARAARAHAETCPTCGARLREQAALWSLLGTWQTARTAPDMTADVLARVDRDSREVLSSRLRWYRWSRGGRIAASVLIAVGIGHLAGRWMIARSAEMRAASVPVDTAEVAASLGLDALTSPPIGLAAAVETAPDEADTPEDRS